MVTKIANNHHFPSVFYNQTEPPNSSTSSVKSTKNINYYLCWTTYAKGKSFTYVYFSFVKLRTEEPEMPQRRLRRKNDQ